MDYIDLNSYSVPVVALNAVVVGSGAAGFACAGHLHKLGVTGVAIITEGVNMGTSRNAGSDKQTYYKLALTGNREDSISALAESLREGGAMHGDLALVEAAGSARAFFNLVSLGVPFPTNEFGEYAAFRTDHDGGRGRATSCGPLTSKIMTERLEDEARRGGVAIFDNCRVIELFTRRSESGAGKSGKEISGLLAMCADYVTFANPFGLICFSAPSIVWATGGPASIYAASVYPESQTGAHGTAFLAGAEGCNLTESQYGIASLKPRWNLSGTYQQVVPRYFSVDSDGVEREFLRGVFPSETELFGAVFRKGYEWPFDPRKAETGSSRVDLAVYVERGCGRRVYMDFSRNPSGFSTALLPSDARDYLASSGASGGLPIDRLIAMNRRAAELFASHGVDLRAQPVEIDVCAQHNNGGLAVDMWYESTSLGGFFVIGEAAGIFGVTRPGGSALNSTQVGALRAAQKLARDRAALGQPPPPRRSDIVSLLDRLTAAAGRFDTADDILARRYKSGELMSRCGAFIRDPALVRAAITECRAELDGFAGDNRADRADFAALRELMISYDALVAQYVYLCAIDEYINRGGVSRGSYLIPGRPHCVDSLRDKICKVKLDGADFSVSFEWEDARPIPDSEQWFERVYNK